MQRAASVVLFVLLAGLIYGCQPSKDSSHQDSGTTDSTSDATASSPSTPFVPLQQADRELAVKTVSNFLTALKTGDHETATTMLSKKAQTETAKHNLGISPPGSESARFVVDTTGVFRGEDQRIYVLSTWTDTDSRGVTQTYDIAWMLKDDQGRLAITGMVTKIFEDGDELVLNFEDPIDMMKRRREAESEIARRHQQRKREPQNVARDVDGNPIIR